LLKVLSIPHQIKNFKAYCFDEFFSLVDFGVSLPTIYVNSSRLCLVSPLEGFSHCAIEITNEFKDAVFQHRFTGKTGTSEQLTH